MRAKNLLLVLLLLPARLPAQLPAGLRPFTFHATYIQPMSGPQVYLTGVRYTVSVTRDSVSCYLPYRGVAYGAPPDLQDGGLKFTSRRFTCTTTTGRKGRRYITIEPQDAPVVQRLDFTILPRGNASLQALPARRQPVGFTGDIAEDGN